MFVPHGFPQDDFPKGQWGVVYSGGPSDPAMARSIVEALPEDEDTRYTLGLEPGAPVILAQYLERMLHHRAWVVIVMEGDHYTELYRKLRV
jgi:hypothetical protein